MPKFFKNKLFHLFVFVGLLFLTLFMSFNGSKNVNAKDASTIDTLVFDAANKNQQKRGADYWFHSGNFAFDYIISSYNYYTQQSKKGKETYYVVTPIAVESFAIRYDNVNGSVIDSVSFPQTYYNIAVNEVHIDVMVDEEVKRTIDSSEWQELRRYTQTNSLEMNPITITNLADIVGTKSVTFNFVLDVSSRFGFLASANDVGIKTTKPITVSGMSYTHEDAMTAISNIGTVSYTEESRTLIREARKIYNFLTDTEKASVSNYDVLLKAESDYNDLLEINCEAKIGDVAFETVEDALNNAKADDIIILKKDIDLTDKKIIIDKNIILDLNGHIMTSPSYPNPSLYVESDNIVLTIDNSKPQTGGFIGLCIFKYDTVDSYVILKNCRLTATKDEVLSLIDTNKVASGYEVLDIEDDTFKSIIKPKKEIDLSELTEDYVIQDGQTITGKINQEKPIKLSIADGAIVTLKDAKILYEKSSEAKYNGITCLGNATINVEGINYIKGYNPTCSGIYVPEGKTLIMEGNGRLDVRGEFECGIHVKGNLIINSGHISARGFSGAGIGCSSDSFESITINGGMVRSNGEDHSAGIGTGFKGTGGSIIINGGYVIATAIGNNESAVGIGHGYEGSVNSITINKDVIGILASSDNNDKCIATSENSLENVNIASNLSCETIVDYDITREYYTNNNKLVVDGVVVSDDNNSGEGWSYDKETNTLTLNNYHSEKFGTFFEGNDTLMEGKFIVNANIIYLGKDTLNIKLEGNNVVYNTFNLTENIDEQYISVYVESTSAAIFSNGNIVFTGKGHLKAKSGKAEKSAAINAYGRIKIDGSNITAIGEGGYGASVGLATNVGLLLSKGSLTAIGMEAKGTWDGVMNVGIYSNKNDDFGIQVDNNFKELIAKGYKRAIDGKLSTAVSGYGYTDMDGTAGKAVIDANYYEKLDSYKMVQFNGLSSDVVIEIIDEIGEVTLTPECKAKIDAAKEAYDKLDEDSRTDVTNYQTLLIAIETYNALLDEASLVRNGENRYMSLEDAIDDANENDTIILLKDIDLTLDNSHIEITKSIKFDLNGHTLTSPLKNSLDDSYLYVKNENIVVTIDNTKPLNGGLIGLIKFADSLYNTNFDLIKSYKIFHNTRTIYDLESLSNSEFKAFYRIDEGFEVISIEDFTFSTIIKPKKEMNLSDLTKDYTVYNGQTLTGTLDKDIMITIEPGATVILKDVEIRRPENNNIKYSGITCLGDATIILEGSNIVEACSSGFAGIFIPENYTLTIDGNGMLTVAGKNSAAGIGGIYKFRLPIEQQEGMDAGNIVINNGYIVVSSAGYGAAIGSSMYGSCGNITINGGVIEACGGNFASGIGTGDGGRSGDITINGGLVIAMAGSYNTSNPDTGSAGIGGAYYGKCGNITINGGIMHVGAVASGNADAIGCSKSNSSVGSININSSLIIENPTSDLDKITTITNEAKLYINGVAVDESNNSGEGFTYDFDTNTLTLDDFVFENVGTLIRENHDLINAGIFYLGNDTLNIVINGENKITNKYNEIADVTSAGIFSNGGITISGEGSLNVSTDGYNTKSYGIYSVGLTTIDSGNINVLVGKSKYGSIGIYAYGGLSINGGTLDARAYNYEGIAKGVACQEGNLIIKKDIKSVSIYSTEIAIDCKIITECEGKGLYLNDMNEYVIEKTDVAKNIGDYSSVTFVGTTPDDVMNLINEIDSNNIKYDEATKNLIEAARNAYNTLDDNDKSDVTNYKTLTDAEELFETLRNNAINDVENKIDAIKDITYSLESKSLIEAANNAYSGLLSDSDKALINNKDALTNAINEFNNLKENAINDAIEKINNLTNPEYTKDFKDLLDLANEAYNSLLDGDDAENSNLLTIANNNYDTLKNNAINNAISKIDEIGDVTYSTETKSKIDTARNIYDLILDEDKDNITNYDDLLDAEELYSNVDNVVKKIDSIGNVTYTDTSKELIDVAKDAYSELLPEELALVPNDKLDILNNAYNLYYNVDNVVKAIDTIGEINYSSETKSKIDTAKDLYNNLNADELNILPTLSKNTYNNASNAYMAMDYINQIGKIENTIDSYTKITDAREVYDAISDDAKKLVLDSFVKILTDSEAVFDVIDKINDIAPFVYNPSTRDKVIDARLNYEALTEDQMDIFPVDVLKTLENYEAIISVIDAISSIGEVKYTEESKNLIDNARSEYDELNDEAKALVNNYNLLIESEATYKGLDDKAHANNVKDLINNIGEVKYTEESKDLIDNARSAYDALTEDQKVLVDNYNVLTNAEASYEELEADHTAANLVTEKINKIGKVKYSKESKALIDNARNAYNALTDDQKTLVDNYNTLTKDEADYKAVDDVSKEINNIGNITYNPESDNKIKNARSSYNNLTEEQKSFFPKKESKVLENYEVSYQVLEKIYSIGDIEYTHESEALVNEASEAYNNLTEEQKKLINKDDLNKLNASIDEYNSSNRWSNFFVIIFMSIGSIALVFGFFFIIILIRDNNDNKKNPKLMSIAPVGLLFLQSHYSDPRYITLYVIIGLAVLIWLIIGVILIIKKKKYKE